MAEATQNAKRLLDVQDLTVQFSGAKGWTTALDKFSMHIDKGETVALVGESGSGKSITGLSILQLLPYPAARHTPESSIQYFGKELVGADQKTLRGVRGNDISMIFQEPMMSLNPLHTIEKQVSESLVLHQGLSKTAARKRSLEMLDLVGIANAKSRLTAYPHELSGGQKQRVMIAMALANKPDLLIADEPTTALDVTIEAQILRLLEDLKKELDMALMLITHDLNIVRSYADRTYVMEKGLLVEQGETKALFDAPQQAYTQKLLSARADGSPEPVAPTAKTLIEGEGLKVHFPIKAGILKRTVDYVRAVDGVDFEIREGETLGVVGESGSGKSTLGFAVLRLVPHTGVVRFDGRDLSQIASRDLKPLRRELQIVFQDPFGSLSPRMTVGDIIGEGLQVHEPKLDFEDRDRIIIDAMDDVGLDPNARFRYPHEFSGGQRQRISIARALVLKPRFIVLDEPTSALDKTVQSQVVDLLRNLQTKYNLGYFFISHDMEVVRAMSHKILVMRRGKVMSYGTVEEVMDNPSEPYTRELMKAAFEKRVEDDTILDQ